MSTKTEMLIYSVTSQGQKRGFADFSDDSRDVFLSKRTLRIQILHEMTIGFTQDLTSWGGDRGVWVVSGHEVIFDLENHCLDDSSVNHHGVD